jgi:NTE family protein
MYGIALEGGGARGSYQVGAWKALVELEIDIGGAAGTSVGAINAALILQESLDEAIEIWSTVAPQQLFDIDHSTIDRLRKLEKLPGNMASLVNYLQAAIQDRGIDTTPLRKLLETHINEEKIRKTKKDFGLVTVSITDRHPVEIYLEEIPEGELVEYILASSSLPIFQSHIFDGKRYLDGGFYNNLPINMLLKRGYKEIIAVMIGGFGIHRRITDHDANIIIIEPRESLGAILDFSTSRAKTNIQLGYYDTLKVFNGYRGGHYYISDVPPDSYFASVFGRFPGEQLSELLEKLTLPAGDLSLRSTFEKLIPLIARTLKIEKQSNYGDIVIALLERKARKQNINRFNVYSFKDFLNIVADGHPSPPPLRSKFVRILKRSDLLPWALRESIFDAMAELIIQSIQEEAISQF